MTVLPRSARRFAIPVFLTSFFGFALKRALATFSGVSGIWSGHRFSTGRPRGRFLADFMARPSQPLPCGGIDARTFPFRFATRGISGQ